MTNPFTPSFGRIPPILAGRDFVINDMLHALDQETNAPDLCTLYVGPRGVGKTALMLHIADIAGQYGWVSASTFTQDNMLEDLFEQATEHSRNFVEQAAPMKLKGVSIGGMLGAEWEHRDASAGNWRTRMGRLVEDLNKQGIGLLLAVDEVSATSKELLQLVNVVQQFFGEGRKVALLLAGLPDKVSGLVSHDNASFLRRAMRQDLGLICDEDVAIALQETIEQSGKTISRDALQQAVLAIRGYPYMMQLIGYRSWDAAKGAKRINRKAVEDGISRARIDFKNSVLDATYKSLSAQDRVFLLAMLKDKGASNTAEIGRRMGRDGNYARTYKERLLEQGLITEWDRGYVCFAMPFLRDYLEAL